MASSIGSSRDGRVSRGRKLKLSQRGDPQKRPILTRIYGLIGCLVVTIALIVLLIILQKKLPNGAKSNFNIPVRRDLENVPVQQEHPEVAKRQENVFKAEKRSGELEPRITFAPTFIPEPILHLSLGCYSTQTNCVTLWYPDKLRKRYQEVTCSSTVVATPCSTSTSSTPIFIPVVTPIRFPLFPITPTPTPTTPTCISGTSLEIACTTTYHNIPKAKRQLETTCSTSILGPCSTSSSSSVTTPPISVSSNSCVSTAVSCSTFENADKGFETSCGTSYSSMAGCPSTSSSLTLTPSNVTTPPVSVSSNSTSSSLTTSTPSTVTTPPVSVSSNSCVSAAVSCSTFGNGNRGFDTSCATSYSSITGCPSSSSSSIITTSSSSSISSVSSTLPPTSSGVSSSNVSTPSSSSSSSSGLAVGLISLTGSSSSSSVPMTLPSTVSSSSSSLPTAPPSSVSSSESLVGAALPVSTGSSSTSGSTSIFPSVIVTPASGSSTSPTSIPPILVTITPSGSASLVSAGSPPVTLSGEPTTGSSSDSSIPPPPYSGSLGPAPSVTPVTTAPGSPASLPSDSTSASISANPVVLKIPSGSTSLTGVSTPISPTLSISPSTLSKVPSRTSVPVASVPIAPSTTPSGSPTTSFIGSGSPDLLQSIKATGSLAPSGTSEGGGGGGGGPSPTDDPKTINAQPDIWPVTQTILGYYTPLIVSRGFLMLLSALYHQLETYEPIRQLLIPGGGSLVDYPAMIAIQFAMVCAHIGTGFSAGATFFDTGYCNPTQTNNIKICPPKLSVNPWVIDVIIITLIVQVITIVFVITQWWKKPGGFSADPTSIAGIAAFMGHPEVEQEFVQLPTEINATGLKRRLKGKKFRLGQFATERGIVKYGIMPADDENEPAKKDGFFVKLKDWWSKFQGKFTFLHNWKKNRLLFDALFVMLLLVLLGLTIDAVSRVNKTQVVFLATTAASGTGWRIFIALLGVIVSYYWGRLFRDAQTFAPYIDLGRGSSNPDATILLKRHSIPLTAFFPLLWYCHYTPASVAFIGLIAELLIVALSGLPYRPGQQRGEFLFWGITSLTILTIMLVQLISISIWRRKLPHLPRAPESIAAVMTYVAGTSMTRDFNGLEQLKRHERDQAIRDLEKSYAYWWRREEDGRIRWIVDEVPGSKNRALMDGASDFS